MTERNEEETESKFKPKRKVFVGPNIDRDEQLQKEERQKANNANNLGEAPVGSNAPHVY